MSPRSLQRTDTWTRIGVSVCVLLLPPIVAVAVLAPRPLPQARYDSSASQPVEESSAPLSITEESFRPPSPSLQPSVADPTQFEHRFAAALDRVEEIGSPPRAVPDEPTGAPTQRAAADRPVLAAPEARLHHRHFRSVENRDIATRHAHRIFKQRPSQSPNDQRPAHRIRPAERKQPVNRVDIGNNVRGVAAKRQLVRFARSA